MNEIYTQLYLDTILKLKQGQRPQIKLTPEMIAGLKEEWQKALNTNANDVITKILCILDNTQNTTSELNELFFKTLKTMKDSDLLVYTLSASQKHVIADGLKSGVMIPMEYFEILKNLLLDKNPEVKEWTLRTIETMGPLSLRLRKEVLNAKPGFMKLINSHQKKSAQLIEFLENEWKRMTK